MSAAAPLRSYTLLLFGGICFCVAFMWVVELRHEALQLTSQLSELRRVNQDLRDERRSLQLEYAAAVDYATVLEEARKLQMIEPSHDQGTLIFLSAAARRLTVVANRSRP